MMRITLPSTLIAVAVAALFAPVASAQTTRDAAACAGLTKLQIPGLTLAITKAEWIPAGSAPPSGRGGPAIATTLPAHCRVDGVLDRRMGADGKPYGIGFALALPGDWNGRFLLQGGGGLNGSVQDVLEPRRQAGLLPRRERSMVLRAGHDRLLRADDEGERRD
jgi:hypothetical protein